MNRHLEFLQDQIKTHFTEFNSREAFIEGTVLDVKKLKTVEGFSFKGLSTKLLK